MKKNKFQFMTDKALDDDISIQEITPNNFAIIGLSIKFPGADSLEEFWSILKHGIDCVDVLSHSRQSDLLSYLEFTKNKHKLNTSLQGAYLKNIKMFDHSFFGISHNEASLMDPNHRLFLETAWSAIEDAGYGGGKIKATNTGTFVAFHSNLSNKYADMIANVSPESLPIALTGNVAGIIPGRIAYLLDLKGPSMLIDTTCSSSLVALHTACQSIRSGDCKMAIVGGTHVDVMPGVGKVEIGIESSDGRTKTFDESSDGTGSGEGVAAFVIKSLPDAKRDGDHIYAIIRGSAINHDGASISLTAPNGHSQVEVLTKAWNNARIHPETLSYFEAHGTGTKLGDPIEVESLTKAFRKYTEKNQFCGIGSVKSNIGHLDTVAGFAGLVKCILALQHGEIPPTLHFQVPNSKIKFENSPVYVVDRLTKWEDDNSPRRCGISAFGLGGTNSHIVLEESLNNTNNKPLTSGPHILAISAKSRESLIAYIEKYADFITLSHPVNIADLCYTANCRRDHYRYRWAVAFNDVEELCINIQNTLKAKSAILSDTSSASNGSDLTYCDDISLLFNNFESQSKEKKYEILKKIASTYVAGSPVPWEELYRKGHYAVTHVPTYPFERKSCWLDISSNQQGNELKDCFYQMCWKQSKLPNNFKKEDISDTIAVFSDASSHANLFVNSLRKSNRSVLEIFFGERFEIDERKIFIRESQEDMDDLLYHLKEMNVTKFVFSRFNHHKILSSSADVCRYLEQSVLSVVRFLKSVVNCRWNQVINLFFLVQEVNRILPEDNIMPEGAELIGLGKSISSEFSQIRCRSIDIDNRTDMETVIAELFSHSYEYLVGYRCNKRYVEMLEHINRGSEQEKPLLLSDNGVYIITGGTGGIALEMAHFLAQQNGQIHLALLSRSSLPARNQWKNLMADETDNGLVQKLRKIISIEQCGATVETFGVNVNDEEKMNDVFRKLRGKYGAIRGIIHAAGVAGEGYLANKSLQAIYEVLSPKIVGTRILHHLTKDDNLDFFILMSSVNSLIGQLGQCDYSSGNAYLDAFSEYRSQSSLKTIAINWPAWRETGMAYNYDVDFDNLPFKALLPKTAVNLFQAIMTLELPRVIVGEFNEHSSFFKNFNNEQIKVSPEIENVINSVRSSIQRADQRETPRLSQNGVQDTLMAIWRGLLGERNFAWDDNFFEIGGNSIMVINMAKRIDEIYPGAVSAVDIFSYPTINELSTFIMKNQDKDCTQKTDENLSVDVISLLDEVENGEISLEHALKKIRDMG